MLQTMDQSSDPTREEMVLQLHPTENTTLGPPGPSIGRASLPAHLPDTGAMRGSFA